MFHSSNLSSTQRVIASGLTGINNALREISFHVEQALNRPETNTIEDLCKTYRDNSTIYQRYVNPLKTQFETSRTESFSKQNEFAKVARENGLTEEYIEGKMAEVSNLALSIGEAANLNSEDDAAITANDLIFQLATEDEFRNASLSNLEYQAHLVQADIIRSGDYSAASKLLTGQKDNYVEQLTALEEGIRHCSQITRHYDILLDAFRQVIQSAHSSENTAKNTPSPR